MSDIALDQLPSPTTLDAYERISPGSAQRLIATFEAQLRHDAELKAVLVSEEKLSRGLTIATFCVAMLGAFVCGMIAVSIGL